MELESRVTQIPEPSDHTLFSRAAGSQQLPASTASAPVDPAAIANRSQVNSEISLERSNSRDISSNDVASMSQARLNAADGEGHRTDSRTSDSRGGADSNATATDTVMSQGDASSEDHNGVNASVDTTAMGAQQAADVPAVSVAQQATDHNAAMNAGLLAADAAALGVQRAADVAAVAAQAAAIAAMGVTEAGDFVMPGSTWQPDAQTQAGQQEQQHLVTSWQQLIRDPFALLIHLLAFVQSPVESADFDRGASVAAAVAAVAAGDRVKVFQASR